MDQKKIGKFIAELRKNNKLTQEQLAEKLYVDRATVSKWETGSYIANPEMLLKLSKIFQVSVNELLVGERVNQENKNEINEIPIQILKDNKKMIVKIKRILTGSIITIFLLIIMFLSYYFINTYNSISVYKLSGESKNFHISDGLMVFSREKSYINLGNLNNNSNKNITSITLYYMNNNKKIELFHREDIMCLLVNQFGYDEFFKYSQINLVKNNLFLEIIFNNNEKETIKIIAIKDFSNIKIFNNNSAIMPNGNSNNNVSNLNVPNWIKENFEFDVIKNEYTLEIKKSNYLEKYKYIVDAEIYILDEVFENSNNHFEYSINDSIFTYYTLINNNMADDFSYNISSKNCIYGNCDLVKINYFINNYLKQLNINN